MDVNQMQNNYQEDAHLHSSPACPGFWLALAIALLAVHLPEAVPGSYPVGSVDQGRLVVVAITHSKNRGADAGQHLSSLRGVVAFPGRALLRIQAFVQSFSL